MIAQASKPATWIAACALLCLALPASAARVVAVRVGNHPTFTRVVFELDAPAGYRVERGKSAAGKPEIRVTLQAGSTLRSVAAKSVMVDRVAVAEGRERAQAEIQLKASPSRVKELTLSDPPRIVFDLVFPEAKLAALKAAAAAKAAPAPKPPVEVAEKPPAPAPRHAVPAPAPKPAVKLAEKPPAPKAEMPVPAPKPETKVAEKPPAPAPKAEMPAPAPKPEAKLAEKPPVPAPAPKAEMPAPAPMPELKLAEKPPAPPPAPEPEQHAPPAAAGETAGPGPAPAPPAAHTEARHEVPPPAPVRGRQIGGVDLRIWVGAAAGVVAILLALLLIRRRRTPRTKDLDVMAMAGEAAAGHDFGGGEFAIGDDSAASTDSTHGSAGSRPIAAGPGLFDDEPDKESETMDRERQDLPIERGSNEQPRAAAAAGSADVARLVRELERRVAQLETRLDESVDSREKLERQVAAMSEELRVQRAAIARTQRALRSMSRGETEEQATEPALRDPSKPAGTA